MALKVGLIVYAIMAILHLICCFMKFEKGRNYTKVLLMFCLLFICLLNGINTGNLYVLIMLALIFAMISDIFLLMENNQKMFACSICLNLISYLLYIIQMINKLPFKIELYFYIILLAFLLCWCLILVPKLKPYVKELSALLAIYSFTLLFGVVIGLISFLINSSLSSIMLIIGFILFIVSNVMLCVVRFYKPFRRYHFYLMIPYVLAQLLVIYGLLR